MQFLFNYIVDKYYTVRAAHCHHFELKKEKPKKEERKRNQNYTCFKVLDAIL
jgi:hypothetical protein